MYYFIEDGKANRIKIEQDEMPWDVRYDQDGNVGHMMCWYSGYRLGDYKESEQYKDPEEFLSDLVRANTTFEELKKFIKSNETQNKLRIRYEDDEWILEGEYKAWYDKGEMKTHVICTTDQDESWLEDDLIDYLGIGDKLNLLEQYDYYFLPLAVYDHSGITMWCGSRWSHFDAQWDCSDVGWIYTTKKEIFDTGCTECTEENWKEYAEKWLKGEVEMYDMYLQDECYGYILEEWDGDDWIETDSCWGFYSKKWGEELAREIANDSVTTKSFVTEDEVNEFIEDFNERKRDEELIEVVSLTCA